jgi:hypothetical protein
MSNHLTVGQLFHHLYDVCDQRSLDTNVASKSGNSLMGFFAYPRKKVQSRITPPKRFRFRSGFQPIPERFRPRAQALAVYGIRSVRID